MFKLPPDRVHCSTKDVYTSEITFLALHPWYEPAEQCAIDITSKKLHDLNLCVLENINLLSSVLTRQHQKKTTWFESVYFIEYEPATQCAYDTTSKKLHDLKLCILEEN